MKKIISILWLYSSLVCFSQIKSNEIVYLLFDSSNPEECKVDIEGQDYVNLKKYRRVFELGEIQLKICDEMFTILKTDSCSNKILENLKIVDVEYLLRRYDSVVEFKYHLFEKIFFIEPLSDNKVLLHQMHWIDERMRIVIQDEGK